MEFIDTHQHLILRGALGYAWADAIPALAGRDFDRADYAGLVEGLGIVGTIFMETGVDDGDQLYRAASEVDWSAQLDQNASIAVDFIGTWGGVRHTVFGAQRVNDEVLRLFTDLHCFKCGDGHVGDGGMVGGGLGSDSCRCVHDLWSELKNCGGKRLQQIPVANDIML